MVSQLIQPNPYYVLSFNSADEFLLSMLSLGKPLEVSLIGVFDNEGRGSRRDIELPLHQDGKYSEELAKSQGGMYIEKENIKIVGFYCIREGEDKCVTIINDNNNNNEVELKKGEALILDNLKIMHGRKGIVGKRLLLRVWLG